MDLEAPADAWYVYVAVVIITIAFAGIAISFPSAPPPDAQQAANAIDGATGSEYAASAAYEHDASVVAINRQTIEMTNDHGTAHASLGYGTVVPVNGNERLENLVLGQSFEDAYEDELNDPHVSATAEFFQEVEHADENNTDREIYADGEIKVRKLAIPEDEAVGAEVRLQSADDFSADLADNVDELNEQEVDIVGEAHIRGIGAPEGATNVVIVGEELTDTLELEDEDGFWDSVVSGFTSITCDVGGFWCEDQPDIEPIRQKDFTISLPESPESNNIQLVEEDLEDLDDEEGEVDVWVGTYPVLVSLTGPDIGWCESEIDEPNEWVELCGPDFTLSKFDNPHWHTDRGGVHYVTLVML